MSLLCPSALDFFSKVIFVLPGNYMEIGIYDGDVICGLAKQYPDKVFYAVDPFIEDGNTSQHNGISLGAVMAQQAANAKANIASVANVTLFEVSSIKFNEEKTDDELSALSISAVFIDGNHDYKHCWNDYRLAMRLLKNGGVIYCDDLGLEGVDSATAEFEKTYKDRILRRSGSMFLISKA